VVVEGIRQQLVGQQEWSLAFKIQVPELQLALEPKLAKLVQLVQELEYLPEMKPLHSLELG
jgi:hypothetical protein